MSVYGVSKSPTTHCLFNNFLVLTTRKHTTPHYWPFVRRKPLVTGRFATLRTESTESLSLSWRHPGWFCEFDGCFIIMSFLRCSQYHVMLDLVITIFKRGSISHPGCRWGLCVFVPVLTSPSPPPPPPPTPAADFCSRDNFRTTFRISSILQPLYYLIRSWLIFVVALPKLEFSWSNI